MAWLLAVGLFVGGLSMGHSVAQSTANNSGSVGSAVAGLVLAQGSFLTDELQTTDNWEFFNGANGTVANGVLTVTAPTSDGIAMKLKESVWQALGNPTSYYVEMLIRPTSVPSGNKNLGIASNISSDNSKWYYAGFNANGRMQAGNNENLKEYQNSNDGTKLAGSDDFVYYKWRYEYHEGTINFFCNDLNMGRNPSSSGYYSGYDLANYQPGSNGTKLSYQGSIGIYSCGASFEIAAIRVGKLNENQTKLVLQSNTDKSLPLLWSKNLRLLNGTSATGIREDDTVSFTVKAFDASGTADTWTAVSSNPNVLAVTASGANEGVLILKGISVGTATVTVANASDPGSKRTLTYNVAEKFRYVNDSYIGLHTKVYPKIGTQAAYTDGELSIAFDSPPKIANSTGAIFIYKYDDLSTPVDTITFTNATESAFAGERGAVLNIGSQMVRIEGNKLYFTPHYGKLKFQTKYCVVIPNRIITGTIFGKNFTGFSPVNKSWSFTTKAEPVICGKIITVDGSPMSCAHFRTVQKALQYVSDNVASKDGAEIRIAPGTYRELLSVNKNVSFTLLGTGWAPWGRNVVIQYINGNNMNGTTLTRPVAYFNTTGTVKLLNLTLRNPEAKAVVAQAETLYFSNKAGHLIVQGCSFKSEQDTLQVNGYSWFKDCYIEGNTDYIWGSSVVALFENCYLKCISDGSIICHARCAQTSKGYVFLNCLIEAVTGTNYLARDMAGTESAYDNIAFVNCLIKGPGTLNWYNAFTPTPVGTAASSLVGWKYYHLNASTIKAYPVASDYDYELNPAEYKSDYSSRATILGRPTSSSGVWVNTNAWDPEANGPCNGNNTL